MSCSASPCPGSPMEPQAGDSGALARLNTRLSRLPVTREGLLWFAIAVILLLIGLVKAINLITLLASMLAGLVLWNAWTARRQLLRVRAERREDEPAFAQTPFHWAVRLHNTARRAASGLDVRDGDGPLRQSWFVREIAAGGTLDLQGVI